MAELDEVMKNVSEPLFRKLRIAQRVKKGILLCPKCKSDDIEPVGKNVIYCYKCKGIKKCLNIK